MVFINEQHDVTLTPASSKPVAQVLQAAARTATGQSFEQAAQTNKIYQGNGLICQKKMCQSMVGCDDALQCPNLVPDWDKVVKFCGPIQTGGVDMDGSFWTIQATDSKQQLLTSTRKATGMTMLPTAYVHPNMYS